LQIGQPELPPPCGHPSRRRRWRALRMRTECAAVVLTSTDAAEPHPEETANRSSRRTRRALKSCKMPYAIALPSRRG
jgi:hypothetical protein